MVEDSLQYRLTVIRSQMKLHRVDALVVPHHEWGRGANVRYLSGFTGSSATCMVTDARQILLTDGRYALQAKDECPGWDIRIIRKFHELIDILKPLGVASIGLLEHEVTWGFERELVKGMPFRKVKALPDIVAAARAVKNEDEVSRIRSAIRVTEKALEETYRHVRPGVTELELARVFEHALPLGAKLSFDTILVSGVRSAVIHGKPSQKAVERGDIIQFDVGCVMDGYVSDISRVVVVGKASDRQRQIHRAVSEAVAAGLSCYREGVPMRDATVKANDVLASYGFPDMPHGLGHGIGLEVHELIGGPGNHSDFKTGNTVTVEPGIYIEGYGGMRIEDDILITSSGPERLTRLTAELLEI